MTNPFYKNKDVFAGVLFDGTCGFEIAEGTGVFNYTGETKHVKVLHIKALTKQCEPGTIINKDSETHIADNSDYIELTFTNDKSIDSVIDALQALKKINQKEAV